MKISKFQLVDDQGEESLQVLREFNATRRSYPKQASIPEVFQAIVSRFADKCAVVDEEGAEITYRELDDASNRMAQLLVDKGLRNEEPVGILMDASLHRMVALMGILKAGGAYLPIGMEFPFDRQKYILKEAQSRFLFSEKKWIKSLNKLQWECPHLDVILCVDSLKAHSEIEPENELMKKELWDYVGEEAFDDISGGGWVNSYTGENLSRQIMDEYGDNILKKLKPMLSSDFRILEVGCSSGISMFRIAPYVKEYVGTDLSDEILKKTEDERKTRALENITLVPLPAHAIHQLNEDPFDVVIINSVIQCFNGHNYLRDVLGKAINLLKDEGLVFLGDIMDQDRKEALLDSLINFKRQNSDKGYKTKTDWSNELFISYSFFEDLQHDLPQITGVHRTEKIGTDGNELTDFRFDVVLTINKKIPTKPNRPRKKHQLGEADWKNYPTQAVAKKIPSTSLAYIAFTSGTTGFPKGVMVEHKSVLRLVLNTNYVTVLPEDRLMHAAPLSFDASTFEIWAALLNGGVVHTIKKDTLLNFSALEEVLNRSHIQIAWLTSPLFNTLIDFAPQLLQHFRTLLVGGDALSPAHIRKAQEHFPNLKIINGYGPTENTTFSTTFPITKESLLEYPTIPIGRPIANSSCYIFKETNNQHLSPIGIFGELYVAGDGLARGYLNDVLLTNSKFIKHPLLKDERLYRTGDRAKWLPDGNIEFGGRLDEQIKIRGFRIEVKEIEHQLTLQNGVKGAVVVVHENENKEKVLAAYLSTDSEINLDEVKSSLAHFLPDYMIPDFFIVLDSIPLNENGKVDRNALPPVMAARTGQDNTLPRNATEEKLHAIWKRVLGLPSMGVNDNFFQLGGHSLRATQVISLVLEKMSVKISIREIFLHPTIAQLSKVVLSKERVNLVHIERVATQPHYEVSYEQRRLWVLSQFERDQIVYNMPGVYKLTHTNRTIFEQVLQLLIERHESLRTIFVSVEGEPRQKILEWNKDVFALTFHDLRGMVQVQEVVDRMAQEEALKPFALDKGPLFRTTLLQTSEDEYVFLYTLHHIICDGWSVGVIVKEISLLYEVFMAGQQNPLPPLSIQYRDYAAWQRQQLTGHELENHRGYWLQKLQAPLPILNLPTDFARPKVKSFEGKGMAFELDETLSVKTEQLCQTHDATLFMTFLAVVQLVLSKYSKQTDLIIGAPVSGRVHKDLEPLIGFFVNMIVLRQTVDEEITFSEFLKHSKRNVLEAYDHQVHPYDKLIGDLGLQRDISRNPLFDVVVTADVNDLLINGIEVPEKSKVQVEDVALEFNIGSKFDLMLRMIRLENKRIKIDIHFNSGLFKERSILLLKDWIIRTLEAITTDANLRIADLPLNWNIEPTTPKVTAEFNF